VIVHVDYTVCTKQCAVKSHVLGTWARGKCVSNESFLWAQECRGNIYFMEKIDVDL
jgi:hypothetical protein